MNESSLRMYEWIERFHPDYVKRIVSWEQSGPVTLLITLDDGNKEEFNYVKESFVAKSNDPHFNIRSKENWQTTFSYNLDKRMVEQFCTRNDLAEKTEVSTTMLGKYLSRDSIPSASTLCDLAYALECDIDDLA